MPQQSHECCIPGLLLQKPAARHEGKAALGEQAVAMVVGWADCRNSKTSA